MLGVTICAVGRLRQSPEAVLVSDYISRFNKLGRQLGLGPASIVEVEDKTNSGISAEATLLEKSIPKNSVVCILDENGKAITSPDFAALFSNWNDNAIKNVTINEPFFQGHFPGQPVMPGVLSLESMAQATAFFMLHELDDPLKKNMFISGVDKVRYRRLITPGDTLNINIKLVSKKLTLYKFDGTIKIDGQLAVQAKISSNLVDRVEV